MENAKTKPSLDLILPGQKIAMRMSLPVLIKIAKYILQNAGQMRPGEYFKIEGTDKSELTIWFD